ncbi:MAG: hypothetical protein ACXW3O_10900 [Brevundimonas sp.]
MTDPNRPTPARTGDAAPKGPDGDPAARQPAAGGDAPGSSGETRPSGDPDALDQSVGRDEAGQGDARTRDGAI